MKFLNPDSPLMQGLGKIADLMLLNMLALIFCIPIITVGASITALYYMALKIVRGEEIYVWKGFWKSFTQNFRQATIIWLIQIVVMAILGADYYIVYMSPDSNPSLIMQIVFLASVILAMATFLFIYPVLSKFDNTIARTFKNTLIMAVMQMPKLILMAILWALPLLLGLFVMQLFPLVVLFGMVLPACGCAFLYNKFFKRMEDQMMERAIAAGYVPEDPGSEDEHIFSDEVIVDAAKEEKK